VRIGTVVVICMVLNRWVNGFLYLTLMYSDAITQWASAVTLYLSVYSQSYYEGHRCRSTFRTMLTNVIKFSVIPACQNPKS
jgi:hypothetical protein